MVLTLFMLLCLGAGLHAQTTLVAGDIAFTGYNSNNNGTGGQNDFSFIILRSGGISAGTVINFTDNGYKIAGTNALSTVEGTLMWTSSSAMAQFTQVYIKIEPSAGSSVLSLSAGSIAGSFSNFILSQAGDQILAYQGPSTSPTFISGIHMNSDPGSTAAGWDNMASGTTLTQNRSDLPPGLTTGATCVVPDPNIGTSEKDNGVYNCTGSTGPSLAAVRTAINTATNWNIQDVNLYTIPPSCTFGISSPLSATGSSTMVACNGGTTGRASVSASGGSTPYTYSWAPSGGSASLATGLGAGNYTCTVTDALMASTTVTFAITQPASALSSTGSFTNASCNGGSNGRASVSASGGTPGYTYSWTPSGGTAALATGLSANTYTCIITDANNCSRTQTVTVSQPTALSATPSATAVSCNGGSNGRASVSVSGGTPSYFYSWAPSGGTGSTATGLSAGNYTVTITDNNSCTRAATISVTQPSAISTSTSVVNVSCNGYSNGIVAVSATGGTNPYTYTWSPTGGNSSIATGMSAGAYTVAITDNNGCTTSRICTVTQPPAIIATPSATAAICNGGSNGQASVSASGGTPGYIYSWAPSGGTNATATGLSAGNYTVTVEDVNSCQKTATVNVTEPAAMNTSTTVTNVSCNGGSNGTASVTVSGGTPGYTYSWAPSGGTAAMATGLSAGSYTVTVTDANNCTKSQVATITQPTALATSTTVTNVSCNGGSNGVASVSVSGGTAAYTYSWTPSGGAGATATGLVAGNYTVTVTDANTCTKTAFATITQPTALITSTAITNVACNGGSTGAVSVSASGGTPGYTYQWSTGANTAVVTGLMAGAYTATVTDANNCTNIKTVTITQPTALIATATATAVSCNGGSNGRASVSVSGGTPGYTYSWVPSGGTAALATGLAAGNYTVTVTDANNCARTASTIVTQPTAIATSTTVTNVSCNGGSNGTASVTATGGTTPYSYSWAPSGGTSAMATGLSAGSYTVTITDANTCTKTQVATITQPAALATSTTVTNVSCNGGSNGTTSVTATGGTTPYSYSWAPSGGTSAMATGLAAGNYTVTVTDANTCTKTQVANITQPTALSTSTSVTNVSCNGGSNGVASVSVSGGTAAYTYSWTPSGGTGATATGLTAGNYTVTVIDANSCTKTAFATITQPPALTATSSQTNATCGFNNGAASVSVAGGTGAYTYSWTPSGGTAATASGLGAGNYTVTVTDANSCAKTQTFNITSSTTISGVITSTAVSCNGGSNGAASVAASGGTGSYTYTWSPSGGNAATASGLAAGIYTVQVKDATSCTVSFTANVSQPTALSASISFTNVSCNGGSNGAASVSVSGGTAAYTYSWTPSGGTGATATGLSAGSYTVVVTDANSCSLSRTVSVGQPSALSAVTSQTNIACFGGTGSASVAVSGGTAAYSYTWVPSGGNAASATGLAQGNYTVTVRDANLCTLSRTLSLTQPSAITATASQTNVSCNGGSNGAASVSVSGGTGAYSYTWSPSGGNAASATGLAAGVYTLAIRDANSCAASQTVSVTQPAAISAVLSATNISCHGAGNGVAMVTVSGGTGAYSYTWSPSGGNAAVASGLGAGIYTLTIADANLCQQAATVSVTEPPALSAVSSQTDATCNGAANGSASVTVSGGTMPYSYTWTPAGGSASAATGLAAGIYSVMVNDANLCSLTQTLMINEPTAMTSTMSYTDISCFGLANGSASVSVSGGTGAYTYTWMPGGNNTDVISGLSGGTYTVNVEDVASCQLSATVTITEPAAIAYTQSVSICQGQSVTVGTSTYTAAGTYTDVLVSIGGCDSTVTTVLHVDAPPTLTVTASSSTVCAGTSATLTASGANTYTWSNGVTNGVGFIPAATQTYTVTGANGACSVTATVAIVVNPKPNVMANASSTLICIGNSVTLTGSGASTYSWSNGVGNGVAFSPSLTATYTVTGTNASGCKNTAMVTVSVSPCTGIENHADVMTIHVNPNPLSSVAVISISHFDQLASQALSLDLYDNTGRLVKQLAVTAAETVLYRGDLAEGMYYYHLVSNGETLLKGKLVIQ